MNNQNNEDNSTMDIFEYVVKPHENSAKRNFNNSKSNKNMINLWGVAILGTIFITYLNKTGKHVSIIPAAQRAAAAKWSLSRCEMPTPLPNAY